MEATCWKLYFTTGGSWSRRPCIDLKYKELILCSVLAVIAVSASESKFNLTLRVRVVLLASTSDPHAADMGHVESEQEIVHYSSDSSKSYFGFVSRYHDPIDELHDMYIKITFCSWLSWLIDFTVVGAPPYPGFNGCFLTYANQDFFFFYGLHWWYGTPVSVNMPFNVILPLIEKLVLLMLMLIPAIWACEKSRFWRSVQCILTFSISDKDGGNGTLIKVVYCEGEALGSAWWHVRWTLDIGILYYLNLFGRSWAMNEQVTQSLMTPASPLVH